MMACQTPLTGPLTSSDTTHELTSTPVHATTSVPAGTTDAPNPARLAGAGSSASMRGVDAEIPHEPGAAAGTMEGHVAVGAPADALLDGDGPSHRGRHDALYRIKPTHTITVPVNICRALIADMDGDGKNELVMARTDCILHVIQLYHDPPGTTNAHSERSDQVLPHADHVPASVPDTSASSRDQANGDVLLKFKAKWQLPEQVGSLSCVKNDQGTPHILVAQHGGHFVALSPRQATPLSWKTVSGYETAPISTATPAIPIHGNPYQPHTSHHHPMDHSSSSSTVSSASSSFPMATTASPPAVPMSPFAGGATMPTATPSALKTNAASTTPTTSPVEMPTEIVSGLCGSLSDRPTPRMTSLPNLVALCTMDGILKIYDLELKVTKSVDLQAHTQLFSLAKVHLTRAPPTPSAMPGNASLGGKDRGWTACREFAICGWDGMTYLMDVDFNTVHFNYPNRVAAFTAGTYATEPGHLESCLFYANFDDTITVFYDIQLRSLKAPSMLECMAPLTSKLAWLMDDKGTIENSGKARDVSKAFMAMNLRRLQSMTHDEIDMLQRERQALMDDLKTKGSLDAFYAAKASLPWSTNTLADAL